MAKLSSFIISLVIVSMFFGVFSIFLTQMKSGYGEQTGMSEEDLALLNKMDALNSNVKSIQGNVTTFTEKDNPFDVIGNFFSSAWGSVKVAANNLNIIAGENGMIDVIASKTNLGEAGIIIKTGIVTILVAAVVIGILLSLLIKREL